MNISRITRGLTFAVATASLLIDAAPSAAQTVAQAAPLLPPAVPVEVGEAGTMRYGETARIGLGEARTYLTVDADGRPTEIGVVLTEAALEGLPEAGMGHYMPPSAAPAAGAHGAHETPHVHLLDLPEAAGVPFRFLELNWNPSGHEPAGVYEGMPHFDFHFYVVPEAERAAIVPSNPAYAERANRLPAAEYVPEFNAALGPPGLEPAQFAVPMMGVHWVDVRSHELQGLLGNADGFAPFTRTFIHGSWDGRWIFWEPMITRAHILAKKTTGDPAVRDEIIPIPLPTKYQAPGYYPEAYRITWDPETREFRIALTALTERR